MQKHSLQAKAFWVQKEIGRNGYVGCLLVVNGRFVPTALCSIERWLSEQRTFLKERWTGGFTIYNEPRTFFMGLPESWYVHKGLSLSVDEKMTVPHELKHLLNETYSKTDRDTNANA